MHRRKVIAASAAMTCGGVLAAGWALLGSPQPATDAGALPAVHSATTGLPSPPLSVRGPRGFHARVIPVAARPDGSLTLPGQGSQGGWWALGAAAGAARGTVLIAGHVDTGEGLGVFSTLHDLALGSSIDVTGANGRVYRYRITARRTYPRAQLPADLFSPEGVHRLALVTCSGAYDSRTSLYADNLVLYGALTTEPYQGTRRGSGPSGRVLP
ncbi:class F sortase [Streptomyces sp. NPDC003038]|uniref:class F sortase n=1 Tax=unclassified Streptomyces TaxID=2593676 RepID=UPI0033A5A2D7